MFKRFYKNKASVAWTWIYGLAFMFALGILYTIFLYAFEGHLVPTLLNISNATISDGGIRTEISSGITKYMMYFKIMPYVLFFIVIIYMIATSLYKQSGGQY